MSELHGTRCGLRDGQCLQAALGIVVMNAKMLGDQALEQSPSLFGPMLLLAQHLPQRLMLFQHPGMHARD